MADAARNLLIGIDWEIDNSDLLQANNAVNNLRSAADDMFSSNTDATRNLNTQASRMTRSLNNARNSVNRVDDSIQNADESTEDLQDTTDSLVDVLGDVGDRADDVDDLNDVLNDVSENADDASDNLNNMAEQQKQIEELKEEIEKLKEQLADTGDKAEDAGEKLGGMSKIMSGVGTAAKAMAAVAVAAVAAVGAAAINAGLQYDEYFKTIAIGTGASGEELDGLMESFEEIGKNTPRNLEAVAQAVTETNRTLGYSGDELEAYSQQVLNLGIAIEEDYAGFTQASGRAAEVFNLSAQEATDGLDVLYEASRGTRIGMTEFSEILSEFGPSLQVLGYDFTESAALIGSFERQGYNSQQMIDALKASVESMAGEGVTDFAGGMEEMVATLKAFESDSEAAAWATENLGGEAIILADAIRNGALDINDFVAELENAPGAIEEMARETESFQDKLGRFGNNLFFALEPIGSQLLDILGDALDRALPLIESLGNSIEGIFDVIGPALGEALDTLFPLIDGLFSLIDGLVSSFSAIDFASLFEGFSMDELFGDLDIASLVDNITDSLGGLVSASGEAFGGLLKLIRPLIRPLTQIGGTLFPLIIDVISTAVGIIGELANGLAPLTENIFPLMGDLVTQLVSAYQSLFDAVAPIIMDALPPFIELFSMIADVVLPPVISLFSNLIDSVLPPLVGIIQGILGVVEPLIDALTSVAQVVLPPLMEAFGVFSDILVTRVETAFGAVKVAVDVVTGVFTGILDFISNVFQGKWGAAWEQVSGTFSSIVGGLGTIFKGPINVIIRGINKFFSGLNTIKVPDWVPGIGGNGFNFTPLPELARGTESFDGGMALVGEQGPELVTMPNGSGVMPNDRTERLFGQIGELTNVITQLSRNQSQVSGTNSSGQMEVISTGENTTGSGDINYTIDVGGIEITINADNLDDNQMEQLREEMRYEIPNSIEKAFKKIYLKNKPA